MFSSLKKLWHWFWSPTARLSMGSLLIIGMVGGLVLWGGFNWSMELSSTEQFCISCHEIRDNAFEESKSKVHYSNRSGVNADCADCHIPKAWVPKLARKIEAAREVYHHVLGTIDTPEKYNAHRPVMQERVWARMRANDSLACRNCHNPDRMSEEKQKRRAWMAHQDARSTGETCIDCHKGIAHELMQADAEPPAEEEEMDFTI